MSDKRHVVKVTIAGEEFSIRSDESPERTQLVAEHVDTLIRGVLRSNPVVDLSKAAIMTALQISAELHTLREQRAGLAADMDNLSAEVRRWLPPAKRGDTGEQPAISVDGA